MGGWGDWQGAHPHAECLEKGDRSTHEGQATGPGPLSSTGGPFNKSIQATGGPHTCGRNHRRTAEGGECEEGEAGGMTHGGNHCSIPDHPIKTDGEAEGEREREGDVERERGADRKEQWDRQIKDKSLP